MSFSVAQAARMYRVPLVDYGPGRRGVLLGSGAGLMTALMDQVPARWCADTDYLRGKVSAYHLEQFIKMAHVAEGVAMAGWFSYSDPEPLRDALVGAMFARMYLVDEPRPVPAPAYAGHIKLGTAGDCETLEEFVERCWDLWSPGCPTWETY